MVAAAGGREGGRENREGTEGDGKKRQLVVVTRVCSGSAAEHFAAYGSNIMSAGFSRGLYR